MKVVLDCNVLIAAGITNGTCRYVVEVVVREHEWYVSEPTVEEFLAVSQRVPLQRYRPGFEAIYQVLSTVAISVQPDPTPISLPDPDDVVYLHTAVAAQADVLVTGNQKYFPFKHLEGPLWEIRLKGKAGISRALYVTAARQRVVVVRTFMKKTQKAPHREIELALKRAREVLS